MFKIKKYVFVKGASEGRSKLNSFDNALIQAGIGNYNLLKVSSILPPSAQETTIITLSEGSLLPIAYSCLTSDNKGATISAGVAIGIPFENPKKNGVIMEFSSFSSADKVAKELELMVIESMEKREIFNYHIEKNIISFNVNSICTVFAGVALI